MSGDAKAALLAVVFLALGLVLPDLWFGPDPLFRDVRALQVARP